MNEETIPIWAIHRRLYEWILGFAATSIAPVILFFIAIIEALQDGLRETWCHCLYCEHFPWKVRTG